MNIKIRMESKNYHGIFEYETIQYATETTSVGYVNCVMLKDVEEMKKGMKIPFISISYGLLGWNADGELEFDCGTTDTRTSDS